MIKIAICDDNESFQNLSEDIIHNILDSKMVAHSIDKYDSSDVLVASKEQYHLYVLDIEMPGLNGFDSAKIIKEKDFKATIIFVTSHSELVYDSFNYNPFYFIVKTNCNLMYDKFCDVINIFLNIYKQYTYVTLNLPHNEEKQILPNDLAYIDCDKNYLCYHFIEDPNIYIRGKISECQKIFDGFDFVRSHKGYIVNLQYVENISFAQMQIYLKGNFPIVPISATYKNILEQKYRLFLRKM